MIGKNTAPKGQAAASFPEAEWAFHKVPQGELRLCAEWELARVGGKQQKPWLQVTGAEKERLRLQLLRYGALQELPLEFGGRLPKSLGGPKGGIYVTAFVVDVTETEGTLVENFRHWLRTSPNRKKWRKKAPNLNPRWRSLLAKIVVLRANEAGLTREAAIERTAELWKKWTFDQATEGFLSPPHWSRALREAKALRRSLRTSPQVIMGDPPYLGADVPGLLYCLEEFSSLAGRRKFQLMTFKTSAGKGE